LVYGEGFAFGVKEPDGWHGDTGQVATRYGVNVVFQSPNEPPESDVTIRVRVNKKVDENTIEDLNYDMDGYKREFPGVQFGELNVAHAEYKTFAKVVFVQNRFYEYVAYLNPGPGKRFVVSVAMSKKGSPANVSELKAYETVVRSIAWLSR
ncbi:MAG: hypothetical protein ACRD3S_15020, partial [Terracidiphilus sp.]